MKQKQSMVVLVDYKDNYDTATMTANKSMGFDLSAIQSCILNNLTQISQTFLENNFRQSYDETETIHGCLSRLKRQL